MEQKGSLQPARNRKLRTEKKGEQNGTMENEV